MAAVMMILVGCGVSDGDIEHWKHTQRGPRKITTVLVEARYPDPLRMHAARALIEMKHPNANGLELLQGAMLGMPASDREGIVHALVPELQNMMSGAEGQAAQGPSENQIRAKDAAFVLVRGDGHGGSFASADDRTSLSNTLLDWILADFNTRALAGAFTAEQIVNAIGPGATDRLAAAIAPTDTAIPVAVEIAKLINAVGTQAGKQAAVGRVVTVAREVESPQINARLEATARTLLTRAGRPVDAAHLATAVEQLRNSYLLVLFEAIKTLGQPNGTEYLISVAANNAVPVERRRSALSAIAGVVTSANTAALQAIADCAPASPACEVELRGIAVDRLGETHDRAVVPLLYRLFDGSNGGAADQSFTLRWKAGEAILRLGGPAEIQPFMQHLGAARPAPFAGYTFAELNGEAQALGDMSPPPRDAMRAFVAAGTNPQPARLLAMLFLGIKGEERDLATLQAAAGETTATITGEGWTDVTLPTVGAVAARARDGLQQSLHPPQVPGGGAPPAQP